MTGSGVRAVFKRDLNRNPEMLHTPVRRIFQNIWRLGQAGDSKFGRGVCND